MAHASGGGGTTVSAPPVDPQQQALEQQQALALQEQTNILKQQQEDNKVISPMLYSALGFNPTYDENGNLKSLTQDSSITANNKLQADVTGMQLQREKDALSGNLPVNPLVTQQLDMQQQQLTNTLSRNFGPGAATSTPGQTAQNSFNTTRAGIVQAANTGDMTLSQQLAASGTANYAASTGTTLNNTLGINNLGFATAGAFGQNAQGYGFAQQPYIDRSQQTLQASMASAQNRAQAQAGQGALIGSGLGAAVGIAGIVIL